MSYSSRIINKLTNFALISTILFSLNAIVTGYARSCSKNTLYCGLTIYLFLAEGQAIDPPPNPNFLLAAQICVLTQFFLSIVAYIFSADLLDFEQFYAVTLFLAIGFGASNVIVYWVTTGTIEQIMNQTFIDFEENNIFAGPSTILSGVVTLIHLVLLFLVLLIEYRRDS
jgi:hypothetical protein